MNLNLLQRDSSGDFLQPLEIFLFVGRRILILRFPEYFRQAIQHPVLSLMGIRVFFYKFLKYVGNTGRPVRGNLIAYGEMQAHVQEGIR